MFKVTMALVLLLASPLIFSKQSLRQEVERLLPSELVQLTPKTSITDIKKVFGKKLSQERKDTLHFKLYKSQNDFTIGIKDKKYQFFLLELPPEIRRKADGLFVKAYEGLTLEEKNKLVYPEKASHQDGKYLEIDLPEEAMTLKFKNTDKKELHSVLFWNPGEKKP